MPRKSSWRRKYDEDEVEAPAESVPTCWLCERPLGRRVEWHHPIPKSRKGRETVPVHPICHRNIHAHFDNKELAAMGFAPEALRQAERLTGFLKWVADKPADFHAATRRSKDRPDRWKQKGRG